MQEIETVTHNMTNILAEMQKSASTKNATNQANLEREKESMTNLKTVFTDSDALVYIYIYIYYIDDVLLFGINKTKWINSYRLTSYHIYQDIPIKILINYYIYNSIFLIQLLLPIHI